MEHYLVLVLFRAHGNIFFKKNDSSSCSQLPGKSRLRIRAAQEDLNRFIPIPINLTAGL